MFKNDMDFGEIFGFDDAAGETADAAGSNSTEDNSQGAKEQSPAVSDDKNISPGNTSSEENKADDKNFETSDVSDSSQSPEENAKYAAARRTAEKQRDLDVAKAKSEAEQYINDAITSLNLTDPFTGSPITSKADFEKYSERLAQDNKQAFLDRTGFSEDEYQRFINNLPEIKASRALSAEADKARAEADHAKAKAKIEEQLREISKIDPNIKTLEDIISLPSYDSIYDKVKKGYSLSDAYYVVNQNEIISKKLASAKQSALNLTSSKGHLSASSSRGTGAVNVPSDIAAMYREFDPDITDAEIQKHYNKYINNK